MGTYVIVAFREGEPDRQFLMQGGRCLIGRAPQADLLIADSTISREHALIESQNGTVTIEDCGSTNGVYVNGEQVTRSLIKEGDFVSIGAYTVVMRAWGETDRREVPRGETLHVGRDASRLLKEAFRREHSPEHYRALYRLALLLADGLDFTTLLRQALTLVLESANAFRGTVLIRHPEFEFEEVNESLCLDGSLDIIVPNNCLIEFVARSRTGLMTEDARSDPRFLLAQGKDGVARWPAICVPLCGAGRSLGVVYVDAPGRSTAFARPDLEFLTAVAYIIAARVENKYLVDSLVRQERLAALGQGIASISHDVRNFLSGMKLGSQILMSQSGQERSLQEQKALRLIAKSAAQVEGYLTDLLNFVRHDDICRSPTDVHGMINDALEVVRPRAEELGVTLTFTGGGFELANIDAAQMQRVLVNLLKNAVESCAVRGGAVTVSVGARSDKLLIQVRDTGAGIPKEEIARLGEPFFSRKGASGLGLGLAITYRIVEQHEGKIRVLSRLQQGTVFSVTIPHAYSVDRVGSPLMSGPCAIETYKRCPGCGFVWASQESLLKDVDAAIVGYQVNFEQLRAGLFLFNHRCGTTLALPAEDFQHLYSGPVFKERRTGEKDCPGYCLRKDELGACPAHCECAHVREILQIVRRWPKQSSVA